MFLLPLSALLPNLPPLPSGEGWGEGIKLNVSLIYPLILAFSRREKGISF